MQRRSTSLLRDVDYDISNTEKNEIRLLFSIKTCFSYGFDIM